jgi:hypothetical protein
MRRTLGHTGRIQVMEAMDTKPMGAITVLPAIMLPLKAEATRDRYTKGKDTRVRAIRDKAIEGQLRDLSPLARIGPEPLIRIASNSEASSRCFSRPYLTVVGRSLNRHCPSHPSSDATAFSGIHGGPSYPSG